MVPGGRTRVVDTARPVDSSAGTPSGGSGISSFVLNQLLAQWPQIVYSKEANRQEVGNASPASARSFAAGPRLEPKADLSVLVKCAL
ncbi:MAG: hypothetical protein EBS30_13550 [Planctomycetes bacterium]|nr:hypothetical protein [Planctomycetota bacterium]